MESIEDLDKAEIYIDENDNLMVPHFVDENGVDWSPFIPSIAQAVRYLDNQKKSRRHPRR